MYITITITTRVPRRSGAPMEVSAIAHPVGQPWLHEPHLKIMIGPKRPHTADDVYVAVRRLEDEPFEIEVFDDFFDEANVRASRDRMLEALREAVRAQRRKA
ncbi:MAG: hypothetical protein ACR2OE_02915 [Thermomicrobiales bacterium]